MKNRIKNLFKRHIMDSTKSNLKKINTLKTVYPAQVSIDCNSWCKDIHKTDQKNKFGKQKANG